MPDSNSTVTKADRDVSEAFCQLNMLTGPTWRERVAQLLSRHRQSSNAGGTDGLIAHFTRMMEAASNYLEPTTYVARHPRHDLNGPCRFTTEFPMPDENHSDCAKADINGRRDQAFIRDMIYMLDGPEQRAALASLSTPTAEREAGEADEHYTVAMDRRPKEIGGVKVGPGLYRIHWKDGGSSLAAIGMCRNGAWWVAPTNWVEPAVALRIDEDPEGRWSWAGVKALECLDPPALTTPPTPDRIGKDAVREALADALHKKACGMLPANAVGPLDDERSFWLSLADAALSTSPAQPVDETERLRTRYYVSFTDGMQAAAEICGSLAETTYDDSDGFAAATGCEAAIMRVVREQRAEQAKIGGAQ